MRAVFLRSGTLSCGVMAKNAGITLIGADWGCGQVQNIQLMNALGSDRVMQLYHAGGMGSGVGASRAPRMKYNRETHKWHLARTRVLTDTLESVRRQVLEFPRYEDCQMLFDQFMAEQMEFNPKTNMTHYVNSKPDDLLHATTYAMLAGEFYLQGNFTGHMGSVPTTGTVITPEVDPWAMEPGLVDQLYQ